MSDPESENDAADMAAIKFFFTSASVLVSVGCAIETIFLLWWADFRGGYGEWPNVYAWLHPSGIVFLLWLVCPYVAMAMLACSIRSLPASILVFVGVLAASGYGVAMYYAQLSSNFGPPLPPGKETMN